MIDSKKAYVKKRRKAAVFSVVVVLCFGVLLYFVPRAMKMIWGSDDVNKDSGSFNLLLKEVQGFDKYEDSEDCSFDKSGLKKAKMLPCIKLQKENSDTVRCKIGNSRELFLSEKDFFEKWSWGESSGEKYNEKEICSFTALNNLKKLMIYKCNSSR